ncbi:retrovirus-related pol polyprotein from transposon TNT 1-94 [Tanacetum coccineum]
MKLSFRTNPVDHVYGLFSSIIPVLTNKERSGYQQKDRKPSQNDKTEHGMEKTVQNQGQSPKNDKVRVNTEESAVKPEPELKNTIECNLYPSDGPGKPNMKIPFSKVGRLRWGKTILLIKDDTLREKLLNVNRLVAKIEALKDNPVPSSITISFKEKSSGSTTTHVDFSQYDSFIFDLSNDQFPPADRSDFYHEEFADGLAHIISPPEYDRFCFKIEPELGNLTMDVVGNIFQTREPRVHVLNVLPTLELDFIPSSESIFAYVVWIFLPFLFIPVIPPYLLSCGDEDTIFDPGISKDCPDYEDSQFCRSSRVSHPQLHFGPKSKNEQSQSQYEEISSQPEPEAEEILLNQSLPSDGPGKPNNIMADLNIPANDAPMEQAPAVAPPSRTDDQILPLSKWVPINTNFFRAFTASSTIPTIYIQQFWDTMCFKKSIGLYSCQLDKQWFNLQKDILKDALDITPTNDNNPFVAPPSSDTVIEYVNTLGYPSTLRNVSPMSVNALYRPWRAVLSMINMCLTGKTARYDRPRHHVLQILWGIIHHSNIDYAERIWEEYVLSIQTFLTDWKNLATAARGKKKTAHLLIPSVRFTKLIIHHLRTKHNIHPRTGSPLHYSHEESILNTLRFVKKDGREIFGMTIPDALLTDEIKGAPYYDEYQEHVAKYQQFLDAERGKAEERGTTKSSDATKVTKPKAAKVTKPAGDKAPKPTATQPPKPKPAHTQPSKAASKKKQKLVKETPDEPSPAKRSKGGLVGKRRKPKSPLKLVDEPSDEGVPVKDPTHTDEEADLQRALKLSLKEQAEQT